MKGIQTIVGAIALVILTSWFWCKFGWCPKPQAPPATAKPQLIVQSHLIGDWIDLSYSDGATCDPVGTPNFRTGLLLQFGVRTGHPAYLYDSIRIYNTGSTTPDEYSKAGWVWVNIVSEGAGLQDPPMPPDDAFALYPNLRPTTPAGCTATPNVAGGCLRNRCIRGDMQQIQALMTYWQGKEGWSASSKQELGFCTGNTFRFTFHDPFRVEVYKLSNPDNSSTMGAPFKLYASGKVDSIVVAAAPNGPEHGEILLPPWPYP